MLNIENNLKWISTLGGPLILMDRSNLASWKGDLAHEIQSGLDIISDYDRACSVQDYVGLIEVADAKALVLGDLPSHTSYTSISSETFLLIRWIWAEDEFQVLDFMRDFNMDQRWTDWNMAFRVQSGELVLFDSVYSENELPESIEIKSAPGSYKLSTLSFEPNDQVNLFLVKFTSK